MNEGSESGRWRIWFRPEDRSELGHFLSHVGEQYDGIKVLETKVLGSRLPVQAHLSGNCVDLLFISEQGVLTPELGQDFANIVTSQTFGILGATDGPVLHRGSLDTFRTYLLARGPQADSDIYRDGQGKRDRYEALGASPSEPSQIYLGLTQACDRSCEFCVSRTFAPSQLSMEDLDLLLDQVEDRVQVFALTGAGEAMMHPSFWKMLDRLVERCPSATFKMNTSGLSLRKWSGRLTQYPVKNITVSLNAATSETYSLYVGSGHRAVLRGIEELVAARTKAKRVDLRICLSMVLMRSLLNDLPPIVRLAFEMGVEEVQAINLMVHDARLEQEATWHVQGLVNETLDKAERLARRLGVDASLPPRFGSSIEPEKAQSASLPQMHGHRCTEVFTTAYLRPDGELTPCPYYDATIGNIHDSSGLLGVWRGDAYSALRSGMRAGILPLPCQTCAGFAEGGNIDDYRAHWLGERFSLSQPVHLRRP